MIDGDVWSYAVISQFEFVCIYSEIGYSPAAAGGLGLGRATGEERDGGRWCRAR